MIRNQFFIVVLFFVFSCNDFKKPEFIKIDSVQVEAVSGNTVTLSANAYFNNPNLVSGTFSSDGIQVLVNNVLVGNISSSEEFKVPAKKEFAVPLKAVIPLEKIYKNKNALEGILNSIFSKKVRVQYKGDLFYKALGFTYKYPIDITEDIKLKKKK